MRVQSLRQEDPLENEMATHSSILAWKIPWTEDWWAPIHGVTKSQKQLNMYKPKHVQTNMYKQTCTNL